MVTVYFAREGDAYRTIKKTYMIDEQGYPVLVPAQTKFLIKDVVRSSIKLITSAAEVRFIFKSGLHYKKVRPLESSS